MDSIIADIDHLGSEIGMLVMEEEEVLLQAVSVSRGLLENRYGLPVINDDGRHFTLWAKADAWIPVGKAYVALAVEKGVLTARFIRYFKVGKNYEVQSFGTSWSVCRQFVPLDQVLQAIVNKMAGIERQGPLKKSLLLERLEAEVAKTLEAG